LEGKRYLVIGGETAVGRAVAVGLAEAGADVAIASLTQETKAEFSINSALNELWALGRQGVALVIDASDADELRQAVHQSDRELGRISGAVVVSKAGVALDALREALGGRRLIEVSEDGSAEEAVAVVKGEGRVEG
jgi:NAD(P)-dependent dehydrogenase (short-subunit alcohol dehydrogenase family)